MSGAFVFFLWSHCGDFVCTCCPTVGHLQPYGNKISNARQILGSGQGSGTERAKIFHFVWWKILCLANLLGLVKSLLPWSHRAARTIYVSLGVSRWINICNHNIPVSKLTRNEVIIYDRMYTWLSRLTWKSYLTGFPYKILFTSSSSFGGRCFSKQLSKLVNSAAIFYQVTQNDLDWPIVLGRVWDRKR